MSRYFKVVKQEHRKNDGCIKLPTRATEHSAGYDFYSPVGITIPPHEMVMIWTDIKAHMHDDNALLIIPRSSMGKQPIMISNTIGLIDSDYYENPDNDGNIGFAFYNMSDVDVLIKAGERVLQGIFTKYLITEDDNAEEVRTGGTGSTGK